MLFAGGDLPLSGLASLLDHHVPDLVAFSTTMPGNLVTLDPAVRMAREGVVHTADGLLRQAGLN